MPRPMRRCCQMGCASGQGWYFGKPMTGRGRAHLLRHRHASPRATGRCRRAPSAADSRPMMSDLSRRWDGGSRAPQRARCAMVKTALSISPCRSSCRSACRRSDPSLRPARRASCSRRRAARRSRVCPTTPAVRADLCRRLPVHDGLSGLSLLAATLSRRRGGASSRARPRRRWRPRRSAGCRRRSRPVGPRRSGSGSRRPSVPN